MKKVTLLIPCYNEEKSLPQLHTALCAVMDSLKGYAWEVLLIDDGSRDATPEVMKQLRKKDPRVAYITLSRNFGKENAMLAGFDYASGDCVILLDADLQHPPSLIPAMLERWESGVQDVYARRDMAQESWLRRRISRLYYKLLNRSTRFDVLENVGDFRLLDRRCVDALRQLRESQRYTKGMYVWIGFRKAEIGYHEQQRAAGQSSFNFRRLADLAIDGLTSYTTAPLRLSTLIGFICALMAIFYMLYVFVKTLVVGEPVQGFPTIVILILFLGGVQLISLGIIGEYLGKVFIETKHRPVYLIDRMEGIHQRPCTTETPTGSSANEVSSQQG